MTLKKTTLFLFFFFVILSFNFCKDRELCFTPPQPAYFKFVDAVTGENLITNGMLSPADFKLKDENNNTETFNVITENNLNAVLVNVGWQDGTKNYTFDLGNSKTFKFKVVSRKLTGNCGGYVVEKVEIIDAPFTMDDYFYLVKL